MDTGRLKSFTSLRQANNRLFNHSVHLSRVQDPLSRRGEFQAEPPCGPKQSRAREAPGAPGGVDRGARRDSPPTKGPRPPHAPGSCGVSAGGVCKVHNARAGDPGGRKRQKGEEMTELENMTDYEVMRTYRTGSWHSPGLKARLDQEALGSRIR